MNEDLLLVVGTDMDATIDTINKAVAFNILPLIAAAIDKEADKVIKKDSPDEFDPFAKDALQILMIAQIAAYLTYGSIEMVETIQPHMLGERYAAYFFRVEPDLPQP